MTKADIVDFSTANWDIQYEYAYITGTIIHPELEWHFECDDPCDVLTQHEMAAEGICFSGNKHYMTIRIDVAMLMFTTVPDIEEDKLRIVQGNKWQSINSLFLGLLLANPSAMSMQYAGTGKSATLEFGSQVTPEANSVVTSNPNIVLKNTYDYTHPFVIKAPYGHRLELQLANSDLEIRTITKYKPAWHNNEDPNPFTIKEANLADAQIVSNLPQQIMWIAGEMHPEHMMTTGASGVLYWLTLSQEGRAKLKQETVYNAPLIVRDVTAGITLQVPLRVAVVGQ